MDRPTVSIDQACALTGVCRRTIYNWMRDGKVAYVRTAGGRARIFEDTLWRGKDGQPVAQDGPLKPGPDRPPLDAVELPNDSECLQRAALSTAD